jgi:hypothetical protein
VPESPREGGWIALASLLVDERLRGLHCDVMIAKAAVVDEFVTGTGTVHQTMPQAALDGCVDGPRSFLLTNIVRKNEC